jgi:hypothetical protein
MPDNIWDLLLSNVSYGALFVVLFIWTLRESAKREDRLLGILDCYNKQLEDITAAVERLLEKIDDSGSSVRHIREK